MIWSKVQKFLERPLAVGWQMAFVWLLYLIYLPINDFQDGGLKHDAVEYWVLAVKFQRHHHFFSLLYYDDSLRGYVGPLLMFPALAFRFFTDCSMLTAAKMLGSVWAAALFGFLIPKLWTSVTGCVIGAGRWLLLVLAGFIFWRDYFSFTLTDMPALGTLLFSLWLLSRPSPMAWLLAGLSIAATFNMRLVYIISLLPFLGLAIWWSRRHLGRTAGWRWAALALGMLLTLGPQWAINRIHFQKNTPLPLMHLKGQKDSFYLNQLAWGTRVQLFSGALAYPSALPNYVLIALALTTIRPKQLRWQHMWVILALLLPCAVALPTAIENRFLLPMHLLLLTALTLLFSPAIWVNRFRKQPLVGIGAVLVLGVWVAGCWWLSEAVSRTICIGCVHKLLY
jgi:hypothetical protein